MTDRQTERQTNNDGVYILEEPSVGQGAKNVTITFIANVLVESLSSLTAFIPSLFAMFVYGD